MSVYGQSYYGQPAYGASPFSQPPLSNGYHLAPPPSAPFFMDPSSFRREFSNRLAELTVNSRPIIQNLSMLAHDYARFAEIVAQCLEAHIRKVPAWMKLPAFYLLDMISKNIYEPYARHFATFVTPLFIETYQQVDEATRGKMVELVLTWRTASPTRKELFGVPAQVSVERSIWGEGSSTGTFYSGSGQITKAQVLSELEFTLGQKERAVQTNPVDYTSKNHVNVLQQLRKIVEAGVSQAELQQILTQLRNLMRSNAPAQPTPAPVVSPWPSQTAYAVPSFNPPVLASQPTNQVTTLSLPASGSVKMEETSSLPSSSLVAHLSALTTSASALPTGGYADLLSTLLRAGVVSTNGTPVGTEASAREDTLKVENSETSDQSRSAMRTHRATILGHRVQLSTSGITKTRPPISDMLYEKLPLQCKQCGIRFPGTPDGKKKQEDHLDMHFRQNVKANQNIGRGHSRSWFVSAEDWIHDRLDLKGKGRADGLRPLNAKAAAVALAAKHEAELRSQFVVVPPGDEAKSLSCPICKEFLKSEFLEDDEEWVWKNAIKKDDRIYHATCHEEASTNTLAARLLTETSSRSRSGTPESTLMSKQLSTPPMVRKSLSPSPDSKLLGVKRKVDDDHSSVTGEPDGTPQHKRLALSSVT